MVESNPTKKTALVVQNKNVVAYREELIPCREAFTQANARVKDFKALQGEMDVLDSLRHEALGPNISSLETETIATWKQELDQRQLELGGKQAKIEAEEARRTAINNLIIIKNKLRAKEQVEKGEVSPSAINLIGIPQVPYERSGIKVRLPDSPVLPHNDLEKSGIYGARKLPFGLEWEIDASAGSSKEEKQNVKSLALLMPASIRELNLYFPTVTLNNSNDLARELVRLNKNIRDFEKGKIKVPTLTEIGKPGSEQTQNIARAVRVILLSCLDMEQKDPNVSDNQLRKNYQSRVNDNLRQIANWIGGRKGYEKVIEAIENLPEIEYIMLASRLSTNLDKDLCFVGANCASERKLAESLRDAAYVPNGVKVKHPSYFNGNELSDKLIEVIKDRFDLGEINVEILFDHLEDLGYGKDLIWRLMDRLSFDNKQAVLDMLPQSGYFEEIREKLMDEYSMGPSTEFRLY